MIELDEAGFGYGPDPVLSGVTLTLGPGAFALVTGRAGAGKTTLVRLASGDLAASSGEVRFFGRPIARSNRAAIADLRRAIGVLPQDCRFLDGLSVSENIALPLRVNGLGGAARSEDLRALLEWVDLDGLADDTPATLTRAERRRAALARAVILSPDVILADEPAAGLDDEDGLMLIGLLAELNRMGKCVLVATSDPATVRRVGAMAETRTIELRDGRLAGGGMDDGFVPRGLHA